MEDHIDFLLSVLLFLFESEKCLENLTRAIMLMENQLALGLKLIYKLCLVCRWILKNIKFSIYTLTHQRLHVWTGRCISRALK